MTREEQILSAAREYNSGITFSSPSNVHHFEAGAKWADEHPINDMWHTPDEEPQGKNWCILARDGSGLLWTATRVEESIITSSDWDRFVLKHDLIEWTYYEYPRVTFK